LRPRVAPGLPFRSSCRQNNRLAAIVGNCSETPSDLTGARLHALRRDGPPAHPKRFYGKPHQTRLDRLRLPLTVVTECPDSATDRGVSIDRGARPQQIFSGSRHPDCQRLSRSWLRGSRRALGVTHEVPRWARRHNRGMPIVSAAPRVPVLILGKTITALGVLRVLAGHGVESYVVDATSDIIVRSRWYRPAQRTLPETEDSDELASYLESLHLSRAVLIACSDKWTNGVAGLPKETFQRFPASIAPPAAVAQFLDKDQFRALVGRLGLPHPRSWPLTGPADLDLVTDEDLANGFLKPTDSPRHNLVFGTKGAFVQSRAAAARVVERGTAAGITFMLQEWIPGGMTTTVLIDGFVDRSGTIKGMTARRRLRMNPPRLGNTTAALTVPIDEVGEAISGLRTLLAEVGYRGVFNAEFKFDERDGHFKIIEINPRPAWFVATIARAGLDLPWMSYLDAQELPVPTPPPYQTGRYAVYETPDATSIARAWFSLQRPDGPILKPWLRGDHALFYWSDPLPAVADLWRALRGRLRGVPGRLRRGVGRGQPRSRAG
jgi:D-aspartate ligase